MQRLVPEPIPTVVGCINNIITTVQISLYFCFKLTLLHIRFALLLGDVLGLDWILLFLQPNTHSDTVTRALRILIQLLSIERLQQRFHDGEIFGGWLRGFEGLPPEMTTLIETSVTQLNPLRPHFHLPLPGVALLSSLLPHHLHCVQVFLLMIALLLGNTGMAIPFSASFDMETLDNVFQVGDSAVMNSVKLCPDAAFVLLAMARVLLHQVRAFSQTFVLTQLYCAAVNLYIVLLYCFKNCEYVVGIMLHLCLQQLQH